MGNNVEPAIFCLTQTLRDLPPNDDWLAEREREILAKLRFPKRRIDWRLGRWTAKCALAAYFRNDFRSSPYRDVNSSALLRLSMISKRMRESEEATTKDCFSQIEIRAAADGAPEAFMNDEPIPVSLSISHRDGVGFCAIAPIGLAVGCDLEKVEPRSDGFVADYFTTEEQALVMQASDANRPWLATLMWSAKESVLKALRQGLRLDTRSVIVNLPPGSDLSPWNPFTIHHVGNSLAFHGWWRMEGQHIYTIATESSRINPVALAAAFV